MLHRGIVDRRHGISVPAAARGARDVRFSARCDRTMMLCERRPGSGPRCRSQRRDRRRRARGIARPERGRRQPRPSPLVGRCPHREAPFRMNPPRLFPLVGGRPSATCFCAFKRSQAPRVMAPFVAIQSPLPTMMTHGANPSRRDWKDFSLLVMPIERAGMPLLMWMAEKRGTNRCVDIV